MNGKSVAAIGLIGESGHLTPMAFEALRSGGLSEDALESALAHIGSCEKCAGAFALSFDANELAQVPSGFGEELQKKFKTGHENNHEFAFYVLRVALAACIALIITFSSFFNAFATQPNKIGEIKSPSFDIVNTISKQLKNFSQNLVNMEVLYNAPKKK